MSRDKSKLKVPFRIKVNELVRICATEGVDILVYCCVRSCREQAQLFRKSRNRQEIEQKAQSLTDRGFPFLAQILFDVGPQPGTYGKHVTKAGPGESWHSYGYAADSVPTLGGKPQWESGTPEWDIYGAGAEHLGLNWAGNWRGFKEMPHIQFHEISNPLVFFKDPKVIKDELRNVGEIV